MPTFLWFSFPSVKLGSAGDDVMSGTSGQDWMWGLGGDDTLNGKAGDDVIDGGAGVDWVAYVFDQFAGGWQGVYVDLAAGYAKDPFGNIDTLRNVENIAGTHNPYPGAPWLSDILYGNDADNVISAGDGADYLDGRGGFDRLTGGWGNDYLFGGAGSDFFALQYDAQPGAVDYIGDFQPGSAGDTIFLSSALADKTSFAEGSISVDLGGGNAYTVLAPGATALELQSNTSFV